MLALAPYVCLQPLRQSHDIFEQRDSRMIQRKEDSQRKKQKTHVFIPKVSRQAGELSLWKRLCPAGSAHTRQVKHELILLSGFKHRYDEETGRAQ